MNCEGNYCRIFRLIGRFAIAFMIKLIKFDFYKI